MSDESDQIIKVIETVFDNLIPRPKELDFNVSIKPLSSGHQVTIVTPDETIDKIVYKKDSLYYHYTLKIK